MANESFVKRAFRLACKVYDHPVLQRGYYGRVHRVLLEHTKSLAPMAILDIGTGTGELLGKLAKNFPNAAIKGLDLSAEMLDVAREKFAGDPKIELVEGSVYDLPFPEGNFDLVTSTISSHFYQEFDKALGEIARVLLPGGTLLMASLTNAPFDRVPGPWHSEMVLPGAVYRSPERQAEQFKTAGLKLKSTAELPFPAKLYIAVK